MFENEQEFTTWTRKGNGPAIVGTIKIIVRDECGCSRESECGGMKGVKARGAARGRCLWPENSGRSQKSSRLAGNKILSKCRRSNALR